MRLWSIHPRYLDPQGLVALWREALLARAVLRGTTAGYRHHPQLQRFRDHASPRSAICAYLGAVHADAVSRGYAFDRRKVGPVRALERIPVTRGQVDFEWQHLLRKLDSQPRALPAMAPYSSARMSSVDSPPGGSDRAVGAHVTAFFREAGAGPGVVCLHSNASSSSQWRGLMDLLAPKFLVLAADSYGAGKSPAWPAGRRIGLRDEVRSEEHTSELQSLR